MKLGFRTAKFLPIILLSCLLVATYIGNTIGNKYLSKPNKPAGVEAPAFADFGFVKLADASTPEEFVQKNMANCYARSEPEECYKNVAVLLLESIGEKNTMQILKDKEKLPEIFSRCHEVTHYLGREVYNQERNVAKAYSRSSPVCHGGFYHGVIERHFSERGTFKNGVDEELLHSEIRNVCGRESDFESPRVHAECLHGIGHAMMFITSSDLPKALTLCDQLSNESDKETCYGGSFMENSSSSTNRTHPTEFLKKDDPMYPCSILPTQYLKTCYEYQSSYFAELSNWDWSKTAKLCAMTPSAFQKGCYFIMGTNQVGFTQNTDTMKANCEHIKHDAGITSCFEGITSAIGGRYTGDIEKIDSWCKKLSGNFKTACYEHAGKVVAGLTTDLKKQREMCDMMTGKQSMVECAKGLGL